MKLNEIHDNNEMISTLVEVLFLMEDDSILNESALSSFQSVLAKVGIRVKKEGKGLFDYFKSISKGTAAFIIAAFRGDEKKMKEVIKSVKKEDVIDFFLRFDEATLHFVTAPIYFIEAVTGWVIWANITKKTKINTKSIIDTIKQAIKTIKEKISNIFDVKKRKSILVNLKKIESNLNST